MSKTKKELIKALAEVGECLRLFSENKSYSSFSKLVDEDLYNQINNAIELEQRYNGWFTPENVRKSMLNISKWLTEEKLNDWLSNSSFSKEPKNIGIIMAGNIPLVGFHDFLSVILTGNKATVKLSSDDKHMLPLVIDLIKVYYPSIDGRVRFSDAQNFKSIDALIATGSNNTARYFEKYFGHLPSIIRKNRTSIAVLTGQETDEELKSLGDDIFTYFGMGCRNVTQLFIHEEFDLDRFFGAIVDYADVINHNKYVNNYDYYKAIFLMNQEKLIENGFLLTKESIDLFSPVGVLYRSYFDTTQEVEDYIFKNQDKIQVVVGRNYLPFGKAQSPSLTDYADGIDTIDFLLKLDKSYA